MAYMPEPGREQEAAARPRALPPAPAGPAPREDGLVEAAGLDPSVAFLARHGIPGRLLEMVTRIAALRGTSAREELFALHAFDRSLYWELLARDLGVGFVGSADGLRLDGRAGFIPSEALARPGPVRALAGDVPLVLIAPDERQVPLLSASLARSEHAARHVRVAPPEVIRDILLAHRAEAYVHDATHRLARALPGLSARACPDRASRAGLFTVLAALILAGILEPFATWAIVGTLLTFVFLNGVLWKLLAALHRPAGPRPPPLPEDALPAYSVLVPLYREANVVPDLVTALLNLDYPGSKLQVLLVAEADDGETLAALRRHAVAPRFEIVAVPPAEPRTKPKALAYALPFARGALTVVYDAEDRPEPDQLRKAAALFAASPHLGCVQARLTPDNSETWFSRLFTIEYAIVFEVLLPALADMRAPLPLGGTSNHFPTRVLKAVGAWDPFNVTEDADLGVRLARFGHPTVMLDSRTFEEAPVYWDQWLPQRRRWLKGWMQTAAVCLAPGRPRACRLRPVDWLAVHSIVTAGVVSLLVYPVSAVVVTLAALLLEQGLRPTSALGTALFWLNGFNLFAFLFATYLSALRGLRAVGALRLAPWLFFLPAYWTLMSFAAWQALFQFLTEPSRWEKTRHGVAPQRRTPLKAFRRRRERAGERAGG